MSLGFAEKLSYKENVGSVGMSEIFDPPHVLQQKVRFQYIPTCRFSSDNCLCCMCYFIAVCECSCIVVITIDLLFMILKAHESFFCACVCM